MNTKVNEGKLISGKDALIALANGEEVQIWNGNIWWDVEGDYQINFFLKTERKFRLKPHTITINGIEVPAPFKPKEGDAVFALDNANPDGFSSFVFDSDFFTINFGAWRTKEEIKKVVAALRQVFGGNHDN